MTEQQLLNLKKEIEGAKVQLNQLEGQEKALMNQLQKDWGCKTIAEAEKKLKAIQKEIDTLNEKINCGINELEEKYDI